MRFVLVAAAGLLAASFSARAQQPQAAQAASAVADVLPVGGVMPFGQVPLVDARTGRSMVLDSLLRPQGLLVMFSCNTCPYVVKSQARTLEVIQMAKNREMGMVIINSNEAQRTGDDSQAEMVSYANRQGYSVPYVIDPQNRMADAFGATRTPEVFLFDGRGRLQYKGAMEDNPASPQESKKLYLKSAIENMAAGKPVNPASTKSIGCSIKRRTS